MREFIVVFYGNEISLGIILANWLLWTAFGSGVLGRAAARARSPRVLLAVLQCLAAVVFPLTILLLRASRAFFHPFPGEVLGPGPVLLTSLLVLSVFCSASGLLFAVASAAFAHDLHTSTIEAGSSVYLLEAAGSGLGGLLASLVLIRYFGSFDVASFVSLLNLLAACLVLRTPLFRRIAIGILLASFAVVVFPILDQRLERTSQAWLWRGLQVVETRNSIYGNLAVVKTEGAASLYQNGLVVFTIPDLQAAEEAVHFALLQHPAPKSLLLIGGGMNGGLSQALQHSTLERIDYVELDPAIFEIARQQFPVEYQQMRLEPRIRAHLRDGRLFLKTTAETYDVILLNLPDPETAQLNRFYTLEFFREAAARLNPGGVFSLQLRGAEDYVSPELAGFLSCIRKTLAEAFPQVTFIPGNPFHFFSAMQPGTLAASSQDLQSRLRARHLQTRYVREYYIPYRMMPDRMQEADAQTRPRAGTPVNRDFAPIAYYFDVALWSGRFDPHYRRAFQALAAVPFGPVMGALAAVLVGLTAALAARAGKERLARSAAGFCVAASGFTLMGLEVLLLLGFQAVLGYVYYQLAILIAAFMAGMAAGSWVALRSTISNKEPSEATGKLRTLLALQALMAVAPLGVFALLASFTQLRSVSGIFAVSYVVFPLLALLAGALGGYQFPVASLIYFTDAPESRRHSGTLYGLDVLGACVGAAL
ncbi:MAG TPA: fused MFS/spermidine synthase, partial [Terriglobia bacterium]|nr:fused MFS/spermidine synthase [Terriglobia bacterium]